MKRILLVEDDPVGALVLTDFLTAHGYRVSYARTGAEGAARFQVEKPDMMLIDVMLPRKNGFELCFEVKRTEHGRGMPVILMSAYYRDEDHAQKYKDELRAQAYFVKPFDLKSMLSRIQELLGETPVTH